MGKGLIQWTPHLPRSEKEKKELAYGNTNAQRGDDWERKVPLTGGGEVMKGLEGEKLGITEETHQRHIKKKRMGHRQHLMGKKGKEPIKTKGVQETDS